MSEKKTKTGTTTRQERQLLEQAGKIIVRELARGQDVYIRGFGRFSVGRVKVNPGGPGSTEGKRVTIGKTRFKAYDALKRAVREVGIDKEPTIAEEIEKKDTNSNKPPLPPGKTVDGDTYVEKFSTPEDKTTTGTTPSIPAAKRKPQPVSKIDWG